MPNSSSSVPPNRDGTQGHGTTGTAQSKAWERFQQNGHDPTVRETAYALFHLGIMAWPLARESKDPYRRGWQNERRFHDDAGVGARWGHLTDAKGRVLSRNMCDIDLDCMECIRIAPLYLPETGLKWGRDSKPSSHWIYELTTMDFKFQAAFTDMTPDTSDDPTERKRHKGKMLVE